MSPTPSFFWRWSQRLHSNMKCRLIFMSKERMHSFAGEKNEVIFQFDAQTLLRSKGLSPIWILIKDAYNLKELFYFCAPKEHSKIKNILQGVLLNIFIAQYKCHKASFVSPDTVKVKIMTFVSWHNYIVSK